MPKYDARQEIEKLSIAVTGLGVEVKEIKTNHLPHLEAKIDVLLQQINGRPSWAVTTIISLLTGLVALLGTMLAKTLH